MMASFDIPTAECLIEREGLVNEGLDVRSFNEDNLSVVEICSIFGPKYSKNDWLCDAMVDANKILALYMCVTEKKRF